MGKKIIVINKSSYIGEILERQKRFDFHNYHSMLCVSIIVSLSLEPQFFFLNELVTFIIKSRRIQNSYNIIKKKKKRRVNCLVGPCPLYHILTRFLTF